MALLFKPDSPTPSSTGSSRSFQRDTERGIKVLQDARFCSEEAHKYTNVRPKHDVQPALARMAQVEHHKVGSSGYI